MDTQTIKDLEKRLWDTADDLRANTGLKSSEYSTPILGLIFLKFADSKYGEYEEEIIKEYNELKGTRREKTMEEIAKEKCGFYLPDKSRYSYLLDLKEEENIAGAIKEAIEEMEKHSPDLAGILPKNSYHNLSKEDNSKVLNRLLRNFNDIPTDIENDIFGEIYEYFLGNFALAEGQGGGEFFTPRTIVQYMVEVLKPTEGKILDPACGSGGMFVQTAHYIKRQKKKTGQNNNINLRAYGVEKTGETANLAKMNLFLNNIRGDITEGNSYYADPYDSFENFDYVMTNPPFKEKKAVKLSAKKLYESIIAIDSETRIIDWFKDVQPRERVKSKLRDILDAHLPKSYDKEIFNTKSDIIFTHIVEEATKGRLHMVS